MPFEPLPKINYTSRDFSTIRTELEDWIKANKPDLWNDFYESNLGEFLIQLIAYHGDLLSFAIDRVAEEATWATMRLYKTALKHSKMIGYQPYGATAASVDVQVDPLPANLSTYGVRILKGAQVKTGDLTFETPQEYNFPAGSTSIEFTLTEGETQSEEFESDGTPHQRFTTDANRIIEGSWSVVVDGIEWDEVDYVEVQPVAGRYYSIEMEGDRSISIRFGDDISGAIPANGAVISVTFRIGGGVAGNVPSGALRTAIAAYQNSTAISLDINNANQATGGQDRETLEHIRRWGPLNVRTVDKAITAEDYKTEAASFADATYGAVSRATAKLREGTLAVPTPNPEEVQTVTGADAGNQSLGNIGGTINTKIAQSFQLTLAKHISRWQINCQRIGNAGNLKARIETDNAGEPSGTLVHTSAEVEIDQSDIQLTQDWFKVNLPDTVRLEAATTYWIVLETTTTPPNNEYIKVYGDSANSYANGKYRYFDGTSWNDGSNIVDMAFKVESEPFDYVYQEVFQNNTELTTSQSLGNVGGVYNDKVAMSFTLSSAIDLSRAQIYLSKFGYPPDIQVRIETDNAGAPSGTLAASRLFGEIAEGLVYGEGYAKAVMDSQQNVAAGTYWMVLSLDDHRTSLTDGGATDLWEASTANANEYYYKGPLLNLPPVVRENYADMTKVASDDALNPGEWKWADDDSIGYSVIYVRLSDDTDPDTKPLNYLLHVMQPVAEDYYYKIFGDSTNNYAGGKFAYKPDGGSWTDGTEIVDAAFKIEDGGPHVVHKDDPILIDSIPHEALSEFTIDGKNKAVFVDPNSVDVYVWIETLDVNGRRTYGPASSGLKAALLTHLDERSVVTTTPFIFDGENVPIDLDLGDVVIDRAYALADIEEAINDEIENFFMDVDLNPGDAFRLSDFYDRIEEVPGVLHFVERKHIDDVEVSDIQMVVRGNITMNLQYPALVELRDITARY